MKKRVKSILSILLSVVLCLVSGITLEAKSNETTKSKEITKSYKLNQHKLDKLEIQIENCNIDIVQTDQSKISCTYKKKYANVSVKQKKGKVSIVIKGKGEESKATIMDRLCLVIPNKVTAKKVIVDNNSAGVSNKLSLNADMILNNKKGAMSYTVPDKFSKTISYKSTKGSGALLVNKENLNKISVKEDKSSISYPKGYSAEKLNKNLKEKLIYL